MVESNVDSKGLGLWEGRTVIWEGNLGKPTVGLDLRMSTLERRTRHLSSSYVNVQFKDV